MSDPAIVRLQSGANNNLADLGNGAADAVVGTFFGPITQANAYIFNGTTWDRRRSATATNGTTGTGLAGAAVVGFTGTVYHPVYVNINPGDTLAIGSFNALDVIAFNYVFNGTTFDRARGGTDGTALTGAARTIPVAWSFLNIPTSTTTTVKSGAGVLHTLNVNKAGTTSTVAVYDNTAGSGTLIGTFSTLAPASFLLDCAFATGLTLVTAGGAPADVTVSYR